MMFISHLVWLELPLTMQITICNNDCFNCNPFVTEPKEFAAWGVL